MVCKINRVRPFDYLVMCRESTGSVINSAGPEQNCPFTCILLWVYTVSQTCICLNIYTFVVHMEFLIQNFVIFLMLLMKTSMVSCQVTHENISGT